MMDTEKIDIEECEIEDDFLFKDGVPITGTVFADIGEMYSVTDYVEGIEHGLRREWYQGGELNSEGGCFKGVLHGECKEWYASGVLMSLQNYEFGILIKGEYWNEDKSLHNTYELPKEDIVWEYIEVCRKGDSSGQMDGSSPLGI